MLLTPHNFLKKLTFASAGYIYISYCLNPGLVVVNPVRVFYDKFFCVD